jgi:hypothetical protein
VEIICSECGKAFDGDQCWVCVARKADIEETFFLTFPVALAGIIGTILAAAFYPPLKLNSLIAYMTPAIFFIPGAIVFVLTVCDRLTRWALFVRLMFVLIAAASVMPAAYYFLNGAMDGNPPVKVQALVSSKFLGQGRYTPAYGLVWTLSWNRERIEESSGVSHEEFSRVEPGDFVRVVVHPGAFSTPWYGGGLLSSGDDAIDLGRNRQ